MFLPPVNSAARRCRPGGAGGWRQGDPEPTYRGRLQNFAVPGIAREGEMLVSYLDEKVTLGDGTVVTLRAPSYLSGATSAMGRWRAR